MSWTITLGGVSVGDGSEWYWTEDAPQLFGYDGLRTDDAATPGRWGETSNGPDLPGRRVLQFAVSSSTAPDENAALGMLDELAAAWTIADEDQEITVAAPGRTYSVFGRLRRFQPDLTDIQYGILQVALQLECPDPRLYGPALLAGSGLAAASGGLEFPHGFPHGFGVAGPGEATLTNLGNARTGLTALVVPSDPIVSPSWELKETGELLTFPGLVVPPGTFLAVDWSARTAYLTTDLSVDTGHVDVANFIDRTASDWWTRSGELPPGESTVNFAGASGSGGVLYSYRSAWML